MLYWRERIIHQIQTDEFVSCDLKRKLVWPLI